jgi:hypothetical protein
MGKAVLSDEERQVLRRAGAALRSPLRASDARRESEVIREAVRVLQAAQAREVSGFLASVLARRYCPPWTSTGRA